MRFQLLLALVAIAISLLSDLFILRRLQSGGIARRVFLGISIVEYASIITATALAYTSCQSLLLVMWLIFIFIALLVPKLIFSLWSIIATLLAHILHLNGKRWITATSSLLALTAFGAMWWGALINRYQISVSEVNVELKGLAQSFHGMRIAQISDLHVGTWGNDTTFLSHLVNTVNNLNPDIIVFTGDIVNRESSEFSPMLDTFSKLHAPDGVYAILGNHDYGHYMKWDSDDDRKTDHEKLLDMYRQTSLRLLLDETVKIARDNDSIAIIGVENIGRPPYHTCGDLHRAYPHLSDSLPKILLSHDPNHWLDEIANNDSINIGLTLSGHTHAMQIQIGRHTPASWIFETPWGIYSDSLGHSLYVNRGAGTVGMPMRLGATPEITLITLSTHR